MLTLANCDSEGIRRLQRRLHPARDRRELIFAAGALNNRNLKQDLGSNELATFYDGQVAAGLIEYNPYWPDYAENNS